MIARILTHTLNRLFTNNPPSNTKLRALQNKILTIECLFISPITLQCTVEDNKIKIQTGQHLPSHTTIRGTPIQLFTTGIQQMQGVTSLVNDMSIEGDLELADAWLRLFRELDIDWEEKLSTMIGDVPAYKINHIGQCAKHYLQSTKNAIDTSLRDYLHKETDWFPQKCLLNNYLDDVDKIRSDVERLEANIIFLKKQLQG